MSADLLPCPHCGGEAQDDFIDGESYLIECSVCRAETGIKDSEAEAITAWNRRAPAQDRAIKAEAWNAGLNEGLAFTPEQAHGVAPDADERECDAYLIDSLTKIMAGVVLALKGPEPAGGRHSYHDLPEVAGRMALELALFREREAQGVALTDAQIVAAVESASARGRVALTITSADGIEKPTNVAQCFARALLAQAQPADTTRSDADRAKGRAEALDAARLDYLAENEVWIAWNREGDACRVFVRNEDGEHLPALGWNCKWSGTARDAIDAAIAALGSAK
jgi:Lar family restriction alleviation protein